MNGRLVLAAAGVAGFLLVLGCLSWAVHRAEPRAHPGHTTRPTSGPRLPGQPADRGISSTRLTAADTGRLLPFPPDQIAHAAQLASNFTATYTTHRYNEPPADYVQRLAPMISPQLRPVIERAAGDPVTLDQRRRAQEITTGQARPEAIRAIGPTSITFVVAATEHVATAYAARQDTIHYALTVTRTGTGWQVYAIDLAATGDSGGNANSIDRGGTP